MVDLAVLDRLASASVISRASCSLRALNAWQRSRSIRSRRGAAAKAKARRWSRRSGLRLAAATEPDQACWRRRQVARNRAPIPPAVQTCPATRRAGSTAGSTPTRRPSERRVGSQPARAHGRPRRPTRIATHSEHIDQVPVPGIDVVETGATQSPFRAGDTRRGRGSRDNRPGNRESNHLDNDPGHDLRNEQLATARARTSATSSVGQIRNDAASPSAAPWTQDSRGHAAATSMRLRT